MRLHFPFVSERCNNKCLYMVNHISVFEKCIPFAQHFTDRQHVIDIIYQKIHVYEFSQTHIAHKNQIKRTLFK